MNNTVGNNSLNFIDCPDLTTEEMRFSWFRHTLVGFALETAMRRTRHHLPTELPHWRRDPGLMLREPDLEGALDRIIGRERPPDRQFPKGHPDTHQIKRLIAMDVRSRLAEGNRREALTAAHRLAATDMSDSSTFLFYLSLVTVENETALRLAREHLQRNIVVHVSCEPRLARAQASRESFAPAEQSGASQLIVVGDGQAYRFRFDKTAGVLTVPAPDTYEHLPMKVVSTMFFLALLGHIEAVVKVDDDHRLRNNSELLRGFLLSRRRTPLQIGKLNRLRTLGLHPRAWHFGKAAHSAINSEPFTFPGTTRWANGAAGYFLNGGALWLLLWSYVYFTSYIALGVYEDVVVSDLIERQGGRVGSIDMSRLLTDVVYY